MTRTILLAVTLFMFFVSGCDMKGVSVLENNKALVRRQHEEVWNKGNLEVVDEIYTSDFICHFLAGPEWRGLKGVKRKVKRQRAAFPDWNEEIEDIIAEGDKVVTRFTSRGTHKGKFMGIPRTGKKVKISEVAVFRIADGKIVEQWGYPDLQGLRRQLDPASKHRRPALKKKNKRKVGVKGKK